MSLLSSSFRALGAAWPALRATSSLGGGAARTSASLLLTQQRGDANAAALATPAAFSRALSTDGTRSNSSSNAAGGAAVADAFADTLEIPGGR